MYLPECPAYCQGLFLSLIHIYGTWPQATSKYEKRGVAVKVPAWDASKCVQCNQCSYVCPHAAIRPFLLTEQEVANAPEKMDVADTKPKASEYKYRLQCAVLDCQGCGSCVTVCPTKAISMEPLDTQRHDCLLYTSKKHGARKLGEGCERREMR